VARRWFPFSGNDVQMGLALLGAVVTALSLADVPSVYILWGSIGGAAFLYLAGLIVHSAGTGPRVTFLRGVAERGEGYIDAFRSVKRCLYLMHLDDDPPGAELQALYRVLLQRGVQIRRLIVVRKDASSLAYQWSTLATTRICSTPSWWRSRLRFSTWDLCSWTIPRCCFPFLVTKRSTGVPIPIALCCAISYVSMTRRLPELFFASTRTCGPVLRC
jgi:hypothetical protein